ncbi:MAG: hypothetical protein U0232_24800 [Thermomicrobiales bacterium]
MYKRFARWDDLGVWERLFAAVADDPDLQSVMIDATVVRAPCAAGAPKKRGCGGARALARPSAASCILVDALGTAEVHPHQRGGGGQPAAIRCWRASGRRNTRRPGLRRGQDLAYIEQDMGAVATIRRRRTARCSATATTPPTASSTWSIA